MLGSWCEYPPPLVHGKPLVNHYASMKHLFFGLPLVKALLPEPYKKTLGSASFATPKGNLVCHWFVVTGLALTNTKVGCACSVERVSKDNETFSLFCK